MKTRKFSFLILFLGISVNMISQNYMEGDSLFTFLTDGAEIKVEFNYENLQVKEVKDSIFISEKEYLKIKKEKYDNKLKTGNEWVTRWNDAKVKKYNMVFCNTLNKYTEKRKLLFSDSIETKSIKLVVNVKKYSLGYFEERTKSEMKKNNAGVETYHEQNVGVNKPTLCDFEILFIDVNNPKAILVKIVYTDFTAQPGMFDYIGLNPELSVNKNQLDSDYSRALKPCFGKLGRILGEKILESSKKKKKK
jgi:hypothetical protein